MRTMIMAQLTTGMSKPRLKLAAWAILPASQGHSMPPLNATVKMRLKAVPDKAAKCSPAMARVVG